MFTTRVFTTDISKRLEYHNSGKSSFTFRSNDWKIVNHNKFESKREALIEEKMLKKLNKASIEKLISIKLP